MIRELVHLEKPLAYVLGTQPFHPLPVELLVRPPTLIPRPETEHWLNLLLDRLRPGPRPEVDTFRILDIGTGSGCIALGLTHALRPQTGEKIRVQTVAVDQSEAALALAKENADRCGLGIGSRDACGGSSPSLVSFVQADLFSPEFASSVLSALPDSPSSSRLPSPTLDETAPRARRRFDLVVSNPPYISLHEYETLDPSVREWEDRRALVGEPSPTLQTPDPVSPRTPAASQGHPEAKTAPKSGQQDDGLIFYRRITSLLDALLETPPPPPTSNRDRHPHSPIWTQQQQERQRTTSPPCVAFEVGKGQARAVEQMLRAWRPPSGSALSRSQTPALGSSLAPSFGQAGREQANRSRTDDGAGRAAGDLVPAPDSNLDASVSWRLQTEVVVDPWGVERAVFARWTTAAADDDAAAE
ncbi:hypothetical protein JCM3774_000488 [Rhodotorula dairenensis]